MKLETTKEKILKAAETSEQAKNTLKQLFPEVFEDDRYINLYEMNNKNYHISDNQISLLICIRTSNEYQNKGFYLSDQYNWEIVKDAASLVLLPTKITNNQKL